MKETGTLESFYPTMCESRICTTRLPSNLLQNLNSSSKTSPSPSQRENYLPRQHLKSVSSDSTDPDLPQFNHSKLVKLSTTPVPNCKYPEKSSKKNNSIYRKTRQKPLKSEIKGLKSKSESPEVKFVQLKEKVRNELMLNCNHYIIRSIKKNMRFDEYKVSGLYLDSTQLFNRLSTRMEKPAQSMLPFKVKKTSGTGKIIHKQSLACSKVLEQTSTEWISKHGKLTDSLSFKSNARVIFGMLDPDGKGEISGRNFCEFLIEIGFPLDVFTVFKFVEKFKHCCDIDLVKLAVEDVAELCRSDHRTDSLLVALYAAAGEIDSEKFRQVNVVELFKVLSHWWNELDSDKLHNIHCNDVCDYLVRKQVTCDFSQAYKLVSKCALDGFIDFVHFQLVFVKAFIKHMLVNLQHRFSPEDWSNQDFSNAYKLCLLRKQLILAGILYPVPKITYEEGKAALNAIHKYNKLQNKPLKPLEYSEFCEIWKTMTGEILGKTYTKANIKEQRPEYSKGNNSFTIIGNTDTKLKVKKNWEHSFVPSQKLKEFSAVNDAEKRFVRENKLFKDFCDLVNYDI